MIQPRFTYHPRIPQQAQCVFSGVRSEVYQWDQEMYDGSYTTFELLRFLDGAFTIAITDEGKILITEQEQPAKDHPFLGLPGGSFDSPDEGALACAQRELLEETGYESHDWTLWHTFDGTGNVATFTYFYIARHIHQIQDIRSDPGEKIRTFTLDFEEFLMLSEDQRFHHHWSLIPLLYEARINTKKKEELRRLFF